MKRLDINEYKEIVLQTLVTIDRICRDNDLKYMLMYGSLIGAVRHKGYIPWDDDIDIVMPRQDYYKLMDLINKEDHGINFISIENNDDTIYPYGKVCDTRTTAKEKNFKPVKGYGAFVDVFPLDYMPDDPRKRAEYCKKCRRLMIWITHSSRVSYDKGKSFKTRLARGFAFNLGKLMNTQAMVRKLDRIMAEFDVMHGETSYLGLPWGYNGEELYPAELWKEIIEVDFEGHKFFAPAHYDEILRMRYGDYMKLPPEDERVYAHSIECYIDDEKDMDNRGEN